MTPAGLCRGGCSGGDCAGHTEGLQETGAGWRPRPWETPPEVCEKSGRLLVPFHCLLPCPYPRVHPVLLDVLVCVELGDVGAETAFSARAEGSGQGRTGEEGKGRPRAGKRRRRAQSRGQTARRLHGPACRRGSLGAAGGGLRPLLFGKWQPGVSAGCASLR